MSNPTKRSTTPPAEVASDLQTLARLYMEDIDSPHAADVLGVFVDGADHVQVTVATHLALTEDLLWLAVADVADEELPEVLETELTALANQVANVRARLAALKAGTTPQVDRAPEMVKLSIAFHRSRWIPAPGQDGWWQVVNQVDGDTASDLVLRRWLVEGPK